MEFYNGDEWRQFTYQSDIQNSPSSRGRGVFIWKHSFSSNSRYMSFVNIMTEGNALDFGKIITGRQTRGTSNGTRGFLLVDVSPYRVKYN